MGNTDSKKLYNNVPFPTNAGGTEPFRNIQHYGCGPSAMPHIPTPPILNDPVDGLGRLCAHWPRTHTVIVRPFVKADFFYGMLLTNTDFLNKNLETGMLALCIIDKKHVVKMYGGSYQPAVSQASTEIATGFTEAAQTLPDSPHRLNAAQLKEVTMRLNHAYLDFGVGVLIIEQDKFTYQVLVPNAKEYTRHKEYYDGRQQATKASYVELTEYRATQKARAETDHLRSKRTRSNKSYDGNAVTKKRKQN